MAGPVSAQWTLSQTATDAVSISRGLIEAATSDNVQILALAACEGFGATLPMSPESCAKAHQLCSQTHETTVLTFLKAKVGWRKGDSGWRLSQSDAGLRFLALAACLLSMDWWTASEALRQMIKETAADKTLVPTSHQLKDLLGALNARLACAGFAENVLGWSIWLRQAADQPLKDLHAPSRDTLVEVIKALSGAARIGQTQSVHISVDISEASWIITLVKWCLGIPPTVILPREVTVLEQQESQVFLYPLNSLMGLKPGATVITKDSLGSVSQLISDLPTGLGYPSHGMVRLRVYASKLLERFSPEDSIYYRAGKEAIAHGCHAIFSCSCKPNFTIQEAELLGISASHGWPFPSMEEIAATLATFLGENQVKKVPELAQNTIIEDLPSVQAAKRQICSTCPCTQCQGRTNPSRIFCDFDMYMNTISLCVATVFLASLYIPLTPDGVYLLYSGSQRNISALQDLIYNCIRGKHGLNHVYPHPDEAHLYRCLSFQNRDTVLKAAIDLVGGDLGVPKTDEPNWLMSSAYGQTIYPEVFSNPMLQQTGMLRLRCIPGIIHFNGDIYSTVESAVRFEYHEAPSPDETLEVPAITPVPNECVPHDDYTGARLSWHISSGENKLQLVLTARDLRVLAFRNPMDAVRGVMKSIFVNCPHNRADPVNIAEAQGCYITNPAKPDPPGHGLIGVVLTDRNEHMRYFSLAGRRNCVIREDACINCCIHVCRLSGLKAVVC